MSQTVYSNPFVHTVYYFRDVFDPSNRKDTEGLEHLFLRSLGGESQTVDFAFNRNVGCDSISNGTFMRLNGCCFLKLHAWCLHPTDRTSKKILQYVGRIFIAPLAALIDVVTNTALTILKVSCWPLLRCSLLDEDAIDCLDENIGWQVLALFNSVACFVTSCLGSVSWNLFYPCCNNIYDMDPWRYKVYHFQGEDIPFRRLFRAGQECLFDGIPNQGLYKEMEKHYANWFIDSQVETIFDDDRVKYLKENCGWNKLSDGDLREIKGEQALRGIRVAYRVQNNRLTMVIDGEHTTETQYECRTDQFICKLEIPILRKAQQVS